MGKKNPLKSSKQWGYMQAVRSGASYIQGGPSKKVAAEMIHKTSKRKRKQYAQEQADRRNPLPIPPGTLSAAQTVLEGLVPKKKNKRKRNASEDLSGVEEMSRQFHGREPKDIMDVEEVESFDPHQAVLGELHELGILSGELDKYLLRFKHDKPMLTCDSNGYNLEIIGGDQGLDVNGDNRRTIPLGAAYMIVYETDKYHLEDSDGQFSLYEHFFAEEYYKKQGYVIEDFEDSTEFFDEILEEGIVSKAIADGYLPLVMYDKVDEKLELVGGRYKVEDVGIKD